MNRIRYRLAACLSLFLVILAAWAAEVMVCPKCGYENWQGGKTCEHCGAVLPEVKAAGAPAGAAEAGFTLLPSGKLEFLKPGAVEAEIKLGAAYCATGDVEIARLLLRNASALDMLTNPSITNDRAARIAEVQKKCQPGRGSAQRQCPVCGGTGKTTMRVASLNGEVSAQDVHGKACPRCGGSGTITGPSTADERKFAAGRAATRFGELQQSRKCVPVGGAWVPMEIEQKLSARQMVLLRRAVPPPCQACLGSGRTDCAACKGTGEVKCTNPKCVQGMTQVDVTGALAGGNIKGGKTAKITRTEKCKVCDGKGVVACPACNGAGNILCKECGGTGQLPPCKKCGGQGFATCKRCSGTGVQKDAPCPACGGEGIAICSSCNGDGRLRK